MEKAQLEKRLQELGIYGSYYYRRELKPLAQLLQPCETLNCILTGVHGGSRCMLAITDSRLVVVSSSLAGANVKVVRRSAVKAFAFEPGLFSTAWFSAENEKYVFLNTQRGRKELYLWAMQRPQPEA